jgi:hypothetical protein
MRRWSIPLVLAVLTMAPMGCSKFVLDGRSMTETASMTRSTGTPGGSDAAPFKRSAKAAYLGLAFNLVTLTQPDVPTILKQEINSKGGIAIRNLKIDKKVSFVDGLITFVTFGIYNQETITFEGEVVKAAP